MNRKQPLYRKVNTRARNVHHHFGGDHKHERNTEREAKSKSNRSSMSQGVKRGLDYTPLFRFLLSKVGQDWDEVFKEAKQRLDKPEPIFLMVAMTKEEGEDLIRVGESSYFSGLFVDEDKKLRVVDPSLAPERLKPSCRCCTHTFNGVPFTQKYDG